MNVIRYPMFRSSLEELKKQNLLRFIRDRASRQGPRIRFDGREFINFASNDYLGLAGHPEISAAARNSLERFGFGSGASRLLGGGSTLHRELEDTIAEWKGTEAALILNSGYAANTGLLPALAGEGDILFSDELNHASIIDGCRLSRARTSVFRHRDITHLEELIKESFITSSSRRVVVTDTAFSMDGDIAPLREIYEVCRTYGALLYLDDAHGTGVLGRGKGALAHAGISPEPWIIQMGTFSKALGCFGAFVAGSREVIAWIINTARSFIFTTALPSCIIAASAKALELMEQTPDLIQKLWMNRDRLAYALRGRGFDIGQSETPIIPLKTGTVNDALALSRHLYEKGIYVPAIRPPTVKEPRLRITVTAGHSEEDIRSLISALTEAH
jgi:8-amino-7-oxononanoate synthase